MPVNLFCPQCAAYLGPCQSACPNHACSYQRPVWECLPGPDQPYWPPLQLPGAISNPPLFLADDLSLVAWSCSNASPGQEPGSGLEWIDLKTGDQVGEGMRFERPLAGKPALAEGLVALALGGAHRLGNGAVALVELARRRTMGEPHELPGALACSPQVTLSEVALACGDGQVHRLRLMDRVALAPVRFLPQERIIAGPSAILTSRGRYFIATAANRGQLIAASTQGGRPLAEFNEPINMLSQLRDGRLLVGLSDGSLHYVDPEVWSAPQPCFQAGAALAAPPLEKDGVLYFGARDHCLYGVRLDGTQLGWSPLSGLAGTPGVTPVSGYGLLFVGDSHGVLYALDRQSGALAWRYALSGEQDPAGSRISPVAHDPVTSLARHGERLLAGTRRGRLVCLPWHLGRYAALVEHAEPGAAGEYWSLAADFSPHQHTQSELRLKAAEAWEQSGQSEKSAAMWKAAGAQELAARAYQQAAEVRRITQPGQAAGWYLQAIDLWNDLVWNGAPEGSQEAEDSLNVLLDRLRHISGLYMPLLKMKLINTPSFILHAERKFTLEVKNVGAIAAFGAQFYIGGGLEDDVSLPGPSQPAFEPYLPGEERCYKFVVCPSRSVPLRIRLDYHDCLKVMPPLRTTLSIPIEISEALIVNAGDIGYLKLEAANVVLRGRDIGFVQSKNGPVEVNASGDVAVARGIAAGLICLTCGQANPTGASQCRHCQKSFPGRDSG